MRDSTVHATIDGVILGAMTPAKSIGLKSTFVDAVREALPSIVLRKNQRPPFL